MDIEDVQTGDLVWSRSDRGPDNPGGYRQVELTLRRLGAVVELRVGGQVLRTTGEHPFWVRERGWVATQDLRPGDELAGKDGEWTPVEEVSETIDYETVYHIQVSEHHRYFVGEDWWPFAVWAHNTNAECTIPSNGSQEQTEAVAAPPKNVSYTFKRGAIPLMRLIMRRF